MKQFVTAARRGESGMPNPVAVEFQFETSSGEFVTMTARAPTSGQMALFINAQSESGVAVITAALRLLSWVLDDEHYQIIYQELEGGIAVEVLLDVISYLVEVWSARPTSSPNGSLPSPGLTGRRSTVKPRSTG